MVQSQLGGLVALEWRRNNDGPSSDTNVDGRRESQDINHDNDINMWIDCGQARQTPVKVDGEQ